MPLGPVSNSRTLSGRSSGGDDEVLRRLQGTIKQELAQANQVLPAPRRRETERLIGLVGNPSFYDVVATMDPRDAAKWREMARTQRGFAAAETTFDPKTRAYSESMRLTLHGALIQHVADPGLRGARTLFEAFLELHVTAFSANGGWFDNFQIPVSGAIAVVGATRVSVLGQLDDLYDGVERRDPAAVRAAVWVNQARAAAGP